MMKNMKQKLSAILIILFAVLFIPVIADAKTEKEYQANLWNFKQTIKKTSGAFTYYAYPSRNQKEAWIYKIQIKSGKDCGRLSIPSKLDNKIVTRLGSRERQYLKASGDELLNIFGMEAEPWNHLAGRSKKTGKIKTLILPNTVKVIQPAAFSGTSSIRTVKIPKKVKTLGAYVFFGCDNLKSADLPVGLKSLDTLAFGDCSKLTKIQIPSKNKSYQIKDKCVLTKKKNELVYAMAGGQTFQIPEGVEIIKTYAFHNCASSTVHIPASVRKIEARAFMRPYGESKPNIKNITVDAGNNVYARDGQCIYNKTDKSLSVAIADEKGILYISDQVERLTEEQSMVGIDSQERQLTKVVFPEKLKTVVDHGFASLKGISTYFKGKNPPDLVKEKAQITYGPPNHTHIYVPEGSEEVYRQWYQKYGEYEWISGLDAFKPEDEI